VSIIAANGWDIACYTFGVICIVGPFTLLFWFWKTASSRFRDLGKDQPEPE
jgi:hypothetical protein